MLNKQSLCMKHKLQNGQSIIEVMVAIGLISLVLITLVGAASLSIVSSTFSRNQTQAANFTEQAAEWLRSEKDSGWTTFRSHANTRNWCLTNLSWLTAPSRSCGSSDYIPGTVFVRGLSFTINADGSVQATIQTSWVDARGTHAVPTTVLFTNWK